MKKSDLMAAPAQRPADSGERIYVTSDRGANDAKMGHKNAWCRLLRLSGWSARFTRYIISIAPMSQEKRVEKIEKLDYAERWLRDGLSAIDPPGGFLTIEVNMSQANALRVRMKESGIAVTITQILVRAVASVLTKHPDLHCLTAGNRRLLPGTVDLCVSIGGENVVTPVLIVKDAGSKTLEVINKEFRLRLAGVRSEDEKLMNRLRKWGWMVPGAFLRRALIRGLLNRLWYRRMVSGTFQLTVVPTVDLVVPFLFNTVAALGAGRVSDRVIVIDGHIEIRPILVLACCLNHKVWSGGDAARFLNAVKDELEAG
jgi:pyruvate dehydrogenase E2 component (dihydrolipoamide acetyltransferase)